jgi:uracil-DNA glycosylase
MPYCNKNKSYEDGYITNMPKCRCFETRGVPGPTSELSQRAPAQMGRREAEREGGKEAAGGRQA